MKSVQDLVHDLDNGRGAQVVRSMLVGLSILCILVIFDWRGYHNLSSSEAMDSAQLARSVAEGKGFTTQVIRPLSLCLSERSAGHVLKPIGDSHPDLANPPVYPLVLASMMKLTKSASWVPDTEGGVYTPDLFLTVLNQLLLLGSIVLLFRLAKSLFDVSAAWISIAIFAGTDRLWRFSVSGLSTMLLVVIFMALVFVMVRVEKNSRETELSRKKVLLWAGMVGLVIGVGTLTRYSFGWLIFPALGFLWAWSDKRHRMSSVLVGGGVFAAILAPWLVRNYVLCHSFFGVAGYAILDGTRLPVVDVQRAFSSDLVWVSPKLILAKFLANMALMVRETFPRFGLIGAFFVVGMLVPFQSVTLNRLRWFTIVSSVVLAMAQIIGRTGLSDAHPVINSENLLILILPLVVVYGSAFFLGLLERFELEVRELRRGIIAGFCVLASLPLLLAIVSSRSLAPAGFSSRPEVVQALCQTLQTNELCLSDVPSAVAWYGRRQCALLTVNTRASLDQLEKRKHVSALYLSPLLLNKPGLLTTGTEEGSWDGLALNAIVNHRLPSQFPVRPTLTSLPLGYLFLTDNAPLSHESALK